MTLLRSESIDNYAKALYELNGVRERVSTSALAQRLCVNAASVTGMLKKLSAETPQLVEYEPHQGALLTEEGRRLALEVIRHHRLLETFLVEMLGYSWDEVHEEAEKLEHFISEKFEERIAAALNRPSFDPHGDPIPTRDGLMPTRQLVCLSNLADGVAAVVRRVCTSDAPTLRYLTQLGVEPKSRLRIYKRSADEQKLTIELTDNVQFELKAAIAETIFVEPI